MAILFDPQVVQDQARDELLADPIISSLGIAVVSVDPGDIDTAIAAALEKTNIGVLLLLPSMRAPDKGLPGPFFKQIRLVAEVIENSTLNRTEGGIDGVDYVTAQTLSMMVAAILHWYAPAGINERFYVTDVAAFPDPAKKYNIWHIEMTGGGGVGYNIPQIAPVTAYPAGPGPATVYLSCATLGASIWYTLDGSYPSPRNPTAQLVYLQSSGILQNPDGTMMLNPDGSPMFEPEGLINFPIAVAAEQTLAARAWLNGYRPTKPDQFVFKY